MHLRYVATPLQALCILALNIVIGRAVADAHLPKFQLPGAKMIDLEKFCEQKKGYFSHLLW
jgi:hypothetical protein